MKINVKRTYLMRRVQVFEVEVPDDFDFDRDVVENLDGDFDEKVVEDGVVLDDYVESIDDDQLDLKPVERSPRSEGWIPVT